MARLVDHLGEFFEGRLDLLGFDAFNLGRRNCRAPGLNLPCSWGALAGPTVANLAIQGHAAPARRRLLFPSASPPPLDFYQICYTHALPTRTIHAEHLKKDARE